VQERVERLHALPQAAIEHLPLRRGNDPWHDVEGNQPLRSSVLAVDGERDADAMESAFGFALLRYAARGGRSATRRRLHVRADTTPAAAFHHRAQDWGFPDRVNQIRRQGKSRANQEMLHGGRNLPSRNGPLNGFAPNWGRVPDGQQLSRTW
jgi:hypothetical protein